MTIHADAKNTETVLFWLIPTGTETWSERELIGYDKDGNDGWTVTWKFGNQRLHDHIHVQALGSDSYTQSLLKLDHFYKEKRGSDITSWRKGRLTATELIEDVVEAYINNLFDYSNLKVIENRNLVHWIINKVTAHICLSFFKEWLNIAKQRSKNITVPTSAEIKGMKDRCIPEMAFRFHPDMAKKQSVEFYYETRNTLHSLMDRLFGECPHEKKSIRSSLYSMKSYSPLGASMMYYSHMTEENKELRQNVDQYVLRLTL